MPILSLAVIVSSFLIVMIAWTAWVHFSRKPFIPETTMRQLQPPARAVVASFRADSKGIKKLSRGNTTFEAVSPSETILQGEVVAVEATGSATIALDKTAIQMEPGSELEFANLLPETILLRHRQGEIVYTTTGVDRPLSIRVGRALVDITQGSLHIVKEKSFITIHVPTGSARLAYVKKDNLTQVWHLHQGTKATIDDTAQKVATTGNLLNE